MSGSLQSLRGKKASRLRAWEGAVWRAWRSFGEGRWRMGETQRGIEVPRGTLYGMFPASDRRKNGGRTTDKSVEYLKSSQHQIHSPPLTPIPHIIYHSHGICTFPGSTQNHILSILHKVHGEYTTEARPLVSGSKEVVPDSYQGSIIFGAVV